MKILLIDNYDSFTYNIVEMLRQQNIRDLTICYNDALSGINIAKFDKLIISPGPDIPAQSGQLLWFLKQLPVSVSVLGICLGHQALAECFGATLTQLESPFHGYQTDIVILTQHSLFQKIEANCESANQYPFSMKAGLYHSWVVSDVDFPDCLQITARSAEGHIMAFRHRERDIHGVQFHPESFMTEKGAQIVSGFLNHPDKVALPPH